jgi:tetratricopeptide (TPR) repeat protein
LEHGLRGAEAYRKGGYWNLHGWALTMCFVIRSYIHKGDFANALTYAEDLVRFGQDTNDSQMLVWGLYGRGLVQDRKGDFAEAISNLKKAMELAESVPDHRFRAMAGGDLGKCYLRQGDLGQALAVLEEDEHYRVKYKMKRPFGALRNGLTGLYLLAAEQTRQNERQNWLRKAGRSCREALSEGRKYRIGLAEAMRLKGTYEYLREKPTFALKCWQRSLAVAEEIGMRHELGLTYLEMGMRLKERAHLEKAEGIFGEIGAEWDLAKAQEALASLG